MRSRVFVSLTGPDGNLGDIVIRREVLRWINDPQQGVVAFVGRHPFHWIAAMGFTDRDELVRGGSLRRLLWLLRCALGPHRPILVTDPGETWVRRDRMLQHLIHLVAGLVIKLRGGSIVIPPHALAQQAAAPIFPATLRLHVWFCRLADMCLWREAWSREVVPHGELVADIALGIPQQPTLLQGDRSLCVISFRGDRPALPEVAIQAILAVAAATGLRVVALSQVTADDRRMGDVASALGIELIRWNPQDPSSESFVDHAYHHAALVISDRLHVLLLGLVRGAMPVEMVPAPERKIAAHFEAIGLHDVSYDAQDTTLEEAVTWLRKQLSRRPEALAARQRGHSLLLHAQEQLRLVVRR